ncbi:MAG: [protein-PII] uridylyltransferase [Planctomycetes bacterium]|nr:[protein-PII] uridylyltransferase [Planctomycetota bacterium]
MSNAPDDQLAGLREFKSLLARGRDGVKALHAQGRPPGAVAAALTDLCDQIVARVYRQAIEHSPPEDRPAIVKDLALVALGGYGRRDLAPYSDIDLLFLAGDADSPAVRSFVSRMVRDLWDVGLKLSHSVRTRAGCIGAARQDLTARTALIESRLLIGGSPRFSDLQRQVHRLFPAWAINSLIGEILSQRAKEHQDYHAQTVLLLEPNVKKSPGGLRDYHMLRWLAFARYGVQDPDLLRVGRILAAEDADALMRGLEFLQNLRHEMHFFAGSTQDVLTREEQLRLAEWLNFRDEGPLLGVERFMQQYYRHTTAVNDVVARFIEGLRRPGRLRRIVDRISTGRIEKYFLLSRRTIAVAADARERVLGDAELMLHLFDCARLYNVEVSHETLERLRTACPEVAVTPAARRRFLRLLANPMGLGGVLRRLHRVGLLSRLLPPFEQARCLIQFNLYHKYTVDEHSLRAVEAAARRLDDSEPIGQAYRQVHRKDLLHLALLLHDVGKGLGEDHCEAGLQIAERTAADFGLSEHERQVLCFLVHRHLLMAVTAFRRDLSDEATLVQFARAVTTPELLRLLYVLTAADTEAVSPENWTAWKESLLNELYLRTAEELTGEVPLGDEPTRAAAIRTELVRGLSGAFPDDWLARQLGLMPLSYLETVPVAVIRRHLEILRSLSADTPYVDSAYRPETNFVEYTVFAHDNLVEGLFSKIAGALTASGFQIVSARIVTRADGTVIDTFSGLDLTFTGEPPPDRRQEVADQVAAVLRGSQNVEALLSRRRLPLGGPSNGRPHASPQVEIDNDTSSRFTIVEVFADDRLGRLYTITRTLFELGLSVWSARISTHADQIVDVFYVTTQDGAKTADETQLHVVRQRLIEALETPPVADSRG